MSGGCDRRGPGNREQQRLCMHCGGVEGGQPLPAHPRREPLLELTADIVARRDHPLQRARPTTVTTPTKPLARRLPLVHALAPVRAGPRSPRCSSAPASAPGPSFSPVPPRACACWPRGRGSLGFRSPPSHGTPSLGSNPCRSPSSGAATARGSSRGARPRTWRRCGCSRISSETSNSSAEVSHPCPDRTRVALWSHAARDVGEPAHTLMNFRRVYAHAHRSGEPGRIRGRSPPRRFPVA